MRDAFAHSLYNIAKDQNDVFLLVADISPASSLDDYRRDFPTRLIDTGVAEQTLIGMAAGLALRGFRPFAYTIATFSAYRPFEQIRDDLCYQNLPVTVVGVGAGLSYPSLGATHWSQEDVAVMSALPNMSVIAPCDPAELEFAMRACATKEGPTYLRLGKAGEPDLTSHAPEPFDFGKVRMIKEGAGTCILSYGPIMKMVFDLASSIELRDGGKIAIFSTHTLKPLDRDRICRILLSYSRVIVIEEHSQFGGLAAQVKQLAWEAGATCTLYGFSLKDEFVHQYASQDELRRSHGLSIGPILEQIV